MLELLSLWFYESLFSTLEKKNPNPTPFVSPDLLFFVRLSFYIWIQAAVWDETYNCVVHCSSVFCVHIGLLVEFNFAQVTHVRNCTFFKSCK